MKVKTIFNVWVNGQKSMMHPFLTISRATEKRITGKLMYRYTPNWPKHQGDLASTPIQISLEAHDTSDKRPTPSVRKKPLPARQGAINLLKRIAKSVKVNAKGEVVALDLTGVSLNESHLSAIGTLRSLGSLAMRRTNLTDDGLETIGKLPNLKFLSLGRTRISSDGLRHLKGLKKLKGLRLNGNKGVGDSGVAHLTGMKKLTVLQINNTSITEAGVKKLRRALPNCKIIR